MTHERSARLEQLIEQLEQPALGGFGVAALSLNTLANVMVEELDSLTRDSQHVIVQLSDGRVARARATPTVKGMWTNVNTLVGTEPFASMNAQ